jgi:hypothetical protein
MPEFGQNFRTQILVGLKADGLGEADKLAQEMLRVKRAIDAVREEFNQGALAADLYRKLLRPLIGDLNFLVKEYDAVVGAQDKLEASGARAAAAFAKQEAAAEKAAMAHAGLAQKATLAVQAASDRINALLDKEVAEQLAAAERKAAIDAQAGARHEAELQEVHRKHLEFLAAEEAAEARANARHEAEMQAAHQAHLAFLGQEEAAEVAATAKHEAELQRMHQAHLEFLAKEAAAEAQAQARHDAEMGQAHQKHMEFLAREQAADQAAIDALQRQKDEALRREANRRRNADATFNEGTASRNAQQQIEALERIGAQEQSNVQLYRVLDAELQALIAKGSTRTSTDFDRIDAIKGRMRELLEVMNASGPIFARATSAQSSYNQVINAGAAYAARNATEQARHGTVLEYVSGLVQRMAGRTGDLGHGMDQARSGTEKFGYSVLHVAHAFQDLQYGVGAVLNNIPLVVQAFGGGPGLAGGIMIAAVAFDVLYNNWGKVEKFFGSTGSGVLTPVIDSSKHLAHELSQASSELEKLASKTRLSLPELEKFRELQEKISTIEAEQTERRQTEEIRKIEAEGQTEAGAAFKKAITQAGGGEQAERDLVQALVNVGDRTGQQYTIQGVTKQAEEMMRDAAKGNQEAIDKIRKVIEEFMPSRDRGLADAIQRTDPRRLEDKAWAAKIAKAEAESDKAREREQGQRDDARRRADEALIAGHVATFGAQKALGDLIEGQTKKLISEGEKDPARLRAAARATAEAAIRESKFVPEDLIPAVSAKVAEPHVEKAVARTIAGAAPGQDVVAAAMSAFAAEEAKAKAKEEKPEISHEAARVGHEFRDDIRDAILRRAAQNQTDEQIRKGLAGQVGKRAAEARVAPDLADDVAAKLIGEELGKVRAQQVDRGGVKPQTARAMLGQRQAQAVGRQRGQERQQQGIAVEQLAGQIFQESAPMTGVQFTPEQARTAAQQAVSMTNRGANATQATVGAMQNVINAMLQLGRRLDGLEMQAHMAGARAQQVGHQQAKHRWQQPAPWNTIPGG